MDDSNDKEEVLEEIVEMEEEVEVIEDVEIMEIEVITITDDENEEAKQQKMSEAGQTQKSKDSGSQAPVTLRKTLPRIKGNKNSAPRSSKFLDSDYGRLFRCARRCLPGGVAKKKPKQADDSDVEIVNHLTKDTNGPQPSTSTATTTVNNMITPSTSTSTIVNKTASQPIARTATTTVPTNKVNSGDSTKIDYNVPDTSRGGYYCKLCNKRPFTEKVWAAHINGKVHKMNVKIIADPIDEPVGGGDFRLADVEAKLMTQLKDQELAIVGLDFITEEQFTSGIVKYECHMCNGRFSEADIIPHITSFKHRHSYVQKVDAGWLKFKVNPNGPSARVGSISDRTASLEKQFGQGKIIVKVQTSDPSASHKGKNAGPSMKDFIAERKRGQAAYNGNNTPMTSTRPGFSKEYLEEVLRHNPTSEYAPKNPKKPKYKKKKSSAPFIDVPDYLFPEISEDEISPPAKITRPGFDSAYLEEVLRHNPTSDYSSKRPKKQRFKKLPPKKKSRLMTPPIDDISDQNVSVPITPEIADEEVSTTAKVTRPGFDSAYLQEVLRHNPTSDYSSKHSKKERFKKLPPKKKNSLVTSPVDDIPGQNISIRITPKSKKFHKRRNFSPHETSPPRPLWNEPNGSVSVPSTTFPQTSQYDSPVPQQFPCGSSAPPQDHYEPPPLQFPHESQQPEMASGPEPLQFPYDPPVSSQGYGLPPSRFPPEPQIACRPLSPPPQFPFGQPAPEPVPYGALPSQLPYNVPTSVLPPQPTYPTPGPSHSEAVDFNGFRTNTSLYQSFQNSSANWSSFVPQANDHPVSHGSSNSQRRTLPEEFILKVIKLFPERRRFQLLQKMACSHIPNRDELQRDFIITICNRLIEYKISRFPEHSSLLLLKLELAKLQASSRDPSFERLFNHLQQKEYHYTQQNPSSKVDNSGFQDAPRDNVNASAYNNVNAPAYNNMNAPTYSNVSAPGKTSASTYGNMSASTYGNMSASTFGNMSASAYSDTSAPMYNMSAPVHGNASASMYSNVGVPTHSNVSASMYSNTNATRDGNVSVAKDGKIGALRYDNVNAARRDNASTTRDANIRQHAERSNMSFPFQSTDVSNISQSMEKPSWTDQRHQPLPSGGGSSEIVNRGFSSAPHGSSYGEVRTNTSSSLGQSSNYLKTQHPSMVEYPPVYTSRYSHLITDNVNSTKNHPNYRCQTDTNSRNECDSEQNQSRSRDKRIPFLD